MLLGPIVAVVVTVALLYGDTRFRVLAEPSLALLASVGALATIQRIHPTALATVRTTRHQSTEQIAD